MKCQVELKNLRQNEMKKQCRRQSRRQQEEAGFSLCIAKIFAMLAKITVHRENLNFVMPCFFRYHFAIIAKISLC